MFYYRENYTIPRIQRGSNIFHGGGGEDQLFPGGGVQKLISIETHITCDFPGVPSGSAHDDRIKTVSSNAECTVQVNV